jgi:tetratricopeptide (TPR) repeat protein
LFGENPDDPELVYDLGVIYGNAGQRESALELMVQVLEKNGDHPSALNYVGYTWAERGERLDEAEAYVRRASELRPDDGYITDSLGWVFYQQGLEKLEAGDASSARQSFGLAIEQLELALELLDDGDPVITRHLADAYRSVSRFEEALNTYRRALELEPEEDDADDIRQQIELLESQLPGNASGRSR